ncbi:leucine-rich repeat-containing protein 15 isoform X2 [Cephus cinctus]|uniref:Leucine-rich repeat-containing protein 15 isoform X2 n=1 Tax=Cephus cinctus TaxID=211228 RepID=A0AAJ7BYK4_CEPCN|nr:leucine-rich repeat-containing protein 15 isoform X2 [Cephus cinctus]
MYRKAQTWICFLTCWATVSLTITLQDEASSTVSTSQCLAECICLSFTQVLCNTGGLHEIPNGSLPLTVEDLSLTKNNFPIIRREAFTAHRYLRKLTLDGNNISLIKPFAFRGLPHLRKLSIQHTPLSYVGQYSFAALQNITMLVLAHNKIRYIEGYSFAGTDNVKFIFLSNNPLVTIQSYAFSGLKNVERLILPSGIKEIESDAFNNLQHIGLLKLTYMDLKRLLPYTFRALSYVHVLSIQESDLGVIYKDAFTGLRRINNLNILNNKIDAIKQLNLSADNEIGTFRFLGNHILEAPRASDTILDVGTISALNNHFPCDCQIHNVLESDFVNGSTMEFQLHNFCISPIEFNGKPMSVVDFDGIAKCHEKVFKDNLGSRGQDLRSTLILIMFFLAVSNFF